MTTENEETTMNRKVPTDQEKRTKSTGQLRKREKIS